MTHQIYRGQIVHVVRNPFELSQPETALEHIPDGALVVQGDRIVALGRFYELRHLYPTAVLHDFGDAWIIPGFVDTHIHFPQLDIIGRHSGQLLDWLNQHAFPAEMRFADATFAREAARFFCQELWRNGTTTSMIFSSRHYMATQALFEEFAQAGARAIIGKVSMNRHAPSALLEDVAADKEHNLRLIKAWHGFEKRLFVALTPRFVPSCTEDMLQYLGDLKQQHPQLYIQSHHGENLDEVAWVRELFPNADHYLGVYRDFGLLSPQTMMAHCIYAKEEELKLFADTRTAIAHCPTSNMFLGSGLLALREYAKRGLRLSLATDVGGGTSFSMWRTMDEANKVAKLRGESLHPVELFYLATMGGAASLGLDKEVGSLRVGMAADFQIIDYQQNPVTARVFRDNLGVDQQLSTIIHCFTDTMLKQLVVRGETKLRH